MALSVMRIRRYNHSLTSVRMPPTCPASTETSKELVPVPSTSSVQNDVPLLALPTEIIENVFSFMSFNEVTKVRSTCRRFNEVASGMLNAAFAKLQSRMLKRFQEIKGQMPRRESARRTHPLSRESDIIETLYMRLTLLQMTFGKHIERRHCCFFPGEILDEVYRILHYIRVTPNLGRVYKVTDELFDLSTMAMEYFKEKIEPSLPEISYFGSDYLELCVASKPATSCLSSLPLPSSQASPIGSGGSETEGSPDPPHMNVTILRKKVRRLRQCMKRYNNRLTTTRQEMRTCRSLISDQQKQIQEYSNRLDEYNKKLEESQHKFGHLITELNKCKTELQYWRSLTPPIILPPPIENIEEPLKIVEDTAPLDSEMDDLSRQKRKILASFGGHKYNLRNPENQLEPLPSTSKAKQPQKRKVQQQIGLATKRRNNDPVNSTTKRVKTEVVQ